MEQTDTEPPLVIYVDIDDTLVRSFGSKRIPMPSVVAHVRELSEQGAQLFCWSSGGADYARQSAQELGIAECFTTFLPKPEVLLDDQQVSEWRRLVQVHPGACSGQTVGDYRRRRNRPDAWHLLPPTPNCAARPSLCNPARLSKAVGPLKVLRPHRRV